LAPKLIVCDVRTRLLDSLKKKLTEVHLLKRSYLSGTFSGKGALAGSGRTREHYDLAIHVHYLSDASMIPQSIIMLDDVTPPAILLDRLFPRLNRNFKAAAWGSLLRTLGRIRVGRKSG
jgi:hypothetical protein